MAEKRLLIAAGQTAPDIERLPFGVPREQAAERLREVLDQLEALGASAEGEIGADDPLRAFDDAIAKFHPHHLLIGLRDEDLAGWQERGLLESLHQRLDIPITVFDTPS